MVRRGLGRSVNGTSLLRVPQTRYTRSRGSSSLGIWQKWLKSVGRSVVEHLG